MALAFPGSVIVLEFFMSPCRLGVGTISQLVGYPEKGTSAAEHETRNQGN